MPDRKPGDSALYVYLNRSPGQLAPCPDRRLDAQMKPVRGTGCGENHVLKVYGEHQHKLAVFCFFTGPTDYAKVPSELSAIAPGDLLRVLPEYGGYELRCEHERRYGVRCAGERLRAGEYEPAPLPADVPSFA